MSETSFAETYWEKRKDTLYYQVVRILTSHIAEGTQSMIDVGSAGCPYLDWYDFVPTRTSIDLREPYRATGVKSFAGDFLTWEPDQRYDVVTCMQVLEHVPPAKDFAQKLLSIGDVVIVSVPYKWPAGKTPSHVHDPVDEGKLFDWFGREPNYSYVCRELLAPVDRIIHVYDRFKRPWSGLNHRRSLVARQSS